MARIVLVLLALALLTGCSHPDHGNVVGKHYVAAYDSWYMQCLSYTKKGLCRMSVPMSTHHPEEWVVTLTDGKDEWEIVLDHGSYDRLQAGDRWPQGVSQ